MQFFLTRLPPQDTWILTRDLLYFLFVRNTVQTPSRTRHPVRKMTKYWYYSEKYWIVSKIAWIKILAGSSSCNCKKYNFISMQNWPGTIAVSVPSYTGVTSVLFDDTWLKNSHNIIKSEQFHTRRKLFLR